MHKHGYGLGEDETLSRRLEEFHEYTLFTAAAAVYNVADSLNKAASLLWWAGFGAMKRSFARGSSTTRPHNRSHRRQGCGENGGGPLGPMIP